MCCGGANQPNPIHQDVIPLISHNTAGGRTGQLSYHRGFRLMFEDVGRARPATHGDLRADSTFDLLVQARDGWREALDALFAWYLPHLRRWASGRLPRRARSRGPRDAEERAQSRVTSRAPTAWRCNRCRIASSQHDRDSGERH